MVHSWSVQHVRITIVHKETGEELYLNPKVSVRVSCEKNHVFYLVVCLRCLCLVKTTLTPTPFLTNQHQLHTRHAPLVGLKNWYTIWEKKKPNKQKFTLAQDTPPTFEIIFLYVGNYRWCAGEPSRWCFRGNYDAQPLLYLQYCSRVHLTTWTEAETTYVFCSAQLSRFTEEIKMSDQNCNYGTFHWP